MRKKIIIVGGGITGCMAALSASDMGLDVEIYEKNNNLGGILQDISFKKDKYYRNCQYLNPHESWYKSFIQKKFKIKNFNHIKFSINNFFNKEIFSKGIAGLAVNRSINLKDINFVLSSKKTMQERVKAYPKLISNKINFWLKKNNHSISNLSSMSCDGLGLKRIFSLKNYDKVKKIKQSESSYDDLVGLPDKYLKSQKVLAALPDKGYNFFFKQMESELKKKNVKIYLNSIVKPIWRKNQLGLKYESKNVKNDLIFWSGNPTGLIKNYGMPLLDSDYITSKNFYSKLSGSIKNNFYIQIYDLNHPVTRIFVYKLNNVVKTTIETMSQKLDSANIIKYCNRIFKKFFTENNLKILDNLKNFEIKKKYVLVTNKDYQIIKEFNKKTEDTNLVQGNWLIYSRDDKINFFIKKLKKKLHENYKKEII